MSTPSNRATVYFYPYLHQALRLKAAKTDQSIKPDKKRLEPAGTFVSASAPQPGR